VPVATATSAERKQVSVLFSDLSGFTALSEKLDPEETRQIIGAVFQSATDIVGRYEGRIEKFVGDAIMAIFGVPQAHEDDPQRAIRAALELHRAVEELSPSIEARTGVKLSMHSGVNTGVVVTGELQFDHGTAGPLGDTINTAARLMNAAPSGQLWIGPETIRLAADSIDLEQLGEKDFKGKASAIAVANVLGLRARVDPGSERHLRANFVGRHAELGLLLDAGEKLRDGHGQVIGIRGGAGTGKTRLVREFREQITPAVQWIEGRAYPYSTDAPYAVFLDLLNWAWQIDPSDKPAQVRTKVIAGFENLLGKDSSAQAIYLHLYGLEQDAGVIVEREAFRDQLLATTKRMLAALAERAPLVVCFQDLHWADPSSVSMLADITESAIPGVLLIGNFRPEFPIMAGMQEVELTELSPRQSGELLSSLLGSEPPEQLATFVTDRCDGNPFYVEEIVNSLIETDKLVRDGDAWKLAGEIDEASIPATVRGVIAARIDRLDDSRRQLLRHAAVVGREFLVKVVGQIGETVNDLTPGLAHLQAADLIRQRQTEPDLAYMFKHALTQDVAYDGLLKADRQQLHARTAQVMEEVFSERLPEFVETLAFHYQRGGIADKAIPYLVESGRKCVERYALTEAARHYHEAYELFPENNASQAEKRALTDLLIAWSQVHYYNGTIRSWRSLLEKHLTDAQTCGDASLLVRYMGWLGNVRCFSGQFTEGLQLLEQAHAMATQADAQDDLAIISGWYAFTLVEALRFDEAATLVENTQFGAEHTTQPSYFYAKARAAQAFALLMKSDFVAAREILTELAAHGRRTGNSRAESIAEHFLGIMSWLLLDFDAAIEHGNAGQACARDPLFASMNSLNAVIGHLLKLETKRAHQLSNPQQAYIVENENNWTGLQSQFAHAAAEMAEGNLSDGLRKFQSMNASLPDRGMMATDAMSSALLVCLYTTIARFDIIPSAAQLATNPWFVFTQAPLAIPKTRTLSNRVRSQAAQSGSTGVTLMIDFSEARLLARMQRKKKAARLLKLVQDGLRAAGVEQDPAAVKELAAQLA
jgi:class 3 adenylate cyclase